MKTNCLTDDCPTLTFDEAKPDITAFAQLPVSTILEITEAYYTGIPVQYYSDDKWHDKPAGSTLYHDSAYRIKP